MTYLWREGRIMAADAAPLPDGPGRFETLRVVHGRPFQAAAHLERLFPDPAEDRHEAEACLQDLCGAPGVAEWPLARCRLVWDGSVTGSIQAEPTPQEVVDLAWAETRLPLQPGAKRLPYEPYLGERQRAQQTGCAEALFLNESGRVADASTANIMARIGDQVHAPGPAEGALDGLTRRWILARLADVSPGFAVTETLSREGLLAADEAWISSSVQGIRAVTRIAGQRIGDGGPGTLTQALQQAYAEATR